MALTLSELPYALDALAPYISKETLETHYRQHHRAYIDKANALIDGTRLASLSLEHLVREARRPSALRVLFNNAAQAWNHGFFWQSLRSGAGGPPHGPIADRVRSDFGSYERLADDLATSAKSLFGSGWVWLVLDRTRLRIVQTSNADTPLTDNLRPLLTIDVWEHAYYLDYRNRRDAYVRSVIDHLLNWDFANQNLVRYESSSAA